MAIEKQIDVVWDTDIGRDPDDFLAGCFLLSRPNIRLKAITISPGDSDQVALAKFLLKETGCGDVPVGTVPDREKDKSSGGGCHLLLMKYYKVGMSASADGAGWEILEQTFKKHPNAILFTSGPLNNIGDLLRNTSIEVDLSVSMAGYWPEPGQPLSMPEFNFNGCGWATREFVESKRFRKRQLVGKNVTHQVMYDDILHDQLRAAGKTSRPLALAHELMTQRTGQKKLHDPLAATAIVNENIFEWQEVVPLKRNHQWGSIPSPGSGIWAATSVDQSAFRGMFVGIK